MSRASEQECLSRTYFTRILLVAFPFTLLSYGFLFLFQYRYFSLHLCSWLHVSVCQSLSICCPPLSTDLQMSLSLPLYLPLSLFLFIYLYPLFTSPHISAPVSLYFSLYCRQRCSRPCAARRWIELSPGCRGVDLVAGAAQDSEDKPCWPAVVACKRSEEKEERKDYNNTVDAPPVLNRPIAVKDTEI